MTGLASERTSEKAHALIFLISFPLCILLKILWIYTFLFIPLADEGLGPSKDNSGMNEEDEDEE